MSRRGRDGGATAGCTVTVCQGCCCGTSAGFDHAGQLAQLQAAVADVAVVRVSDCLDTCAHANVIVVQPSPPAAAPAGDRAEIGRE
ncbi:(2Fe-2S) ferredoxin domain-containing protein, partial [Micromonospora aurantiaca]